MRSATVNFLLEGWRGRGLVAGVAGLFLAASFGWLSWTTAAVAVGATLAGILIGRPGTSGNICGSDARALLRTLDQNLEQIAEETDRAIALTSEATEEIGRCFRQWEASIADDDSAATETARAASCEIIRILQFEDISSQALGIGLEGIAECRNALQSLECGRAGMAEVQSGLADWQRRRRADVQRDLSEGSVDIF